MFRQVSHIFVDTSDGKEESGDLIIPVKNNWIAENEIYPVGRLLAGEIIPTPNLTRLFKTVGLALLDLFAAKLVYEKYSMKRAIWVDQQDSPLGWPRKMPHIGICV